MSVGSALADLPLGELPVGWPCVVGQRLLENGIVDAKSQCGRVARHVIINSARRDPLGGRRAKLPDRGRSDPERRLSDFMLHLSIGGVEVSMESLILAQDERWRRA